MNMTSLAGGNVAFASAPAQLAACLSKLVQTTDGRTNSSLPPIFSDELRRSFAPFREERWRFSEVLPFAIQLGHAQALQADQFLDDLEQFLASDGALEAQRFSEFLQWAEDLEQQTRRLSDKSFRDEYMRVLRNTWAELYDLWNKQGLPATKQTAALWNRHFATNADPVPLFPDKLFLLNPVFSDNIQGSALRGKLRITPLWAVAFGFYLPVGDEVYMGFAPETVQFIGKLEERSAQLSTQFAALSNNTRVHLLFLLNEHVPQTVGDLALQLDLPHSNVSTHLKVLQQAGLVNMERSGVRTLVTRNRETIDALRDALKFEP